MDTMPEATEILEQEWAVSCSCGEQVITIPVAYVSFDSADYPYYCGTWTCPRCNEVHTDDENIRPEE